MAARSASSGTPVKSCSTTRATRKGISALRSAVGCQVASCVTCSAVTLRPSQLRSTLSSTMRSDTGRRRTPGYFSASAGSEKNWPCLPEGMVKSCRVLANSAGAWGMVDPG